MGLISNAKKPSVIMGVDCSSKSFAFSVFENGKLQYYGEIEFDSGDIYKRIYEARQRLDAWMHIIPPIDAVYFESSAYINNNQTFKILSYMLGAALSAVINEGTEVYPTAILSWQKDLNPPLLKSERVKIEQDNPGRSKSWVKEKIRQEHKLRGIRKVKEIFDVEVESNDTSDAILIGYYGVRQWQ